MMKVIVFIMISILSLSTFGAQKESRQENLDTVDSIEKSEIISELSTETTQENEVQAKDCLQEFKHRKNVLLYSTVGIPFGYPVGTAAVMFVAGLVDKLLNPSTFLPGLAGAGVGFMIGSAIFLGYETVTIVKLAKTLSMLNLLKHLRNHDPKLSHFYKLARRKLHKSPEQLSDAQILAKLEELDKSGAYCNASLVSQRRLKNYLKRAKSKDALAFKSDVIKVL